MHNVSVNYAARKGIVVVLIVMNRVIVKKVSDMGKVSYSSMTGEHGLLARRVAFDGNSLSARVLARDERHDIGAGYLDPVEREAFYEWLGEHARSLREGYVVFSYRTPIAWGYRDGEIYCTPQRFSVTTSKGQGYVRAWVNHNVKVGE